MISTIERIYNNPKEIQLQVITEPKFIRNNARISMKVSDGTNSIVFHMPNDGNYDKSIKKYCTIAVKYPKFHKSSTFCKVMVDQSNHVTVKSYNKEVYGTQFSLVKTASVAPSIQSYVNSVVPRNDSVASKLSNSNTSMVPNPSTSSTSVPPHLENE